MLDGSPIRQKQVTAVIKILKDYQEKFNVLLKLLQKAKKPINEPADLTEADMKSLFT